MGQGCCVKANAGEGEIHVQKKCKITEDNSM